MEKTKPLLFWILLWVFGLLIITVKNRIVAGVGLSLGRLVTANLLMDLIVVPVATLGFFVMKLILKAVGYEDFLKGKNGLRNIILVWFGLFLLVFLFPLFK